jgi:hypothetical protein
MSIARKSEEERRNRRFSEISEKYQLYLKLRS